MEAMVRSTDDEQQVQGAKSKAKRRAEQILEDTAWILSTPQGRRFYWRLLSECNVFAISYSAESTHQTAFNEGARNIGNQLFGRMEKADAKAFLKMIAEKDEYE